MSDRDFEINGKKFKLSKLDAFKQFHILRRLTPILADLVPAAVKASKPGATEKDQYDALVPIMQGLGNLSDQDADRVLLGLLSAVEMQQEQGGWARVAVNETLMFHHLELTVLLQIAGRAFGYNLKGFLDGLPQALKARG